MRHDRGFNLGEVVASVGILGVVMLSLMGVMVVAGTGASSTPETAAATALAERELESWKQESFAHLVASLGSNNTTQVVDGREYQLTTQIDRLDPSSGSPDYDMLVLATVVNWETKSVDPSTKTRIGRVRLETQVSSVAAY